MVAFKDRNTKLSSTEVVMSDKDFTEQAIFQAEFPDASFVSFTHFKALREKLWISPGECEHALEILMKLAFSSSTAEYAQHYQDLQDSGLQSVIVYYNSNWHPVHHQWVECTTTSEIQSVSYVRIILCFICCVYIQSTMSFS